MSLHEAARDGDVGNIRQLLSANTDAINDRDRHSRTPLHMAAWAGRAEVVKVLCEARADVGAAAQDDMAAIHFACQKGHTEVVRTLLLAGAYVNARNRKGMTPLHFAVQGSYAELVKLLVKKGANFDSENKAKKKPIDLLRDESLRAVIQEAEIERDNRRAKSKEKPKQQQPSAPIEGEEASRPGEFDVPQNPITVSEGPCRERGTAAAKLMDGEQTRVRQSVEVPSNGVDENEEDANVIIGPKRKKSKIALTHLFSENDDDEVD
ncbi:hypothetical protein Mapa_011310 [Marchantia paleacea]|nr:hypothetical protein Mapa_011310 [Marchantia paleacea]